MRSQQLGIPWGKAGAHSQGERRDSMQVTVFMNEAGVVLLENAQGIS
jgi:hypothetical protein